MRQSFVILAAVALLVCAPAAAADVIEVTAFRTTSNRASIFPLGLAGDVVSSRWVVRDRTAHKIGDFVLDCRYVTSKVRLCVGQLTLPLGGISVVGVARTPRVGRFSVVGGTRLYRGVKGVMLTVPVDGFRITVNITLQ